VVHGCRVPIFPGNGNCVPVCFGDRSTISGIAPPINARTHGQRFRLVGVHRDIPYSHRLRPLDPGIRPPNCIGQVQFENLKQHLLHQRNTPARGKAFDDLTIFLMMALIRRGVSKRTGNAFRGTACDDTLVRVWSDYPISALVGGQPLINVFQHWLCCVP